MPFFAIKLCLKKKIKNQWVYNSFTIVYSSCDFNDLGISSFLFRWNCLNVIQSTRRLLLGIEMRLRFSQKKKQLLEVPLAFPRTNPEDGSGCRDWRLIHDCRYFFFASQTHSKKLTSSSAVTATEILSSWTDECWLGIYS